MTQGTPVIGSTSFSSVGLKNGETIGSVTLNVGVGGIAATDAVGSTSIITPSAAIGGTFTASNYNITYVTENLTVVAANLTITANPANRIYGGAILSGAAGSVSFTTSGLQNGESIGSVTIAYATGAASGNELISAVGTYMGKVTPSAAIGGTFTASNYNITYLTSLLTVIKKSLTITAANKTKVYGSANPTLTYSYAGLVNSDAAPSTLPTISTTAVTGSPVGNYSITISGASDANYSISYVNGTLSVTKATLTITADNQTKVEGSPNPTFTISYSGFVVGESASNLITTSTTTCSANTNSTAGTYPIIVSGATAANYTIIYQNGTLTITAPLIMRFEIPNAFIPTDMYMDNKFLRAAYNASVKHVNYFRVFNRMGKLVYEIQNADPSAIKWDGTFNNVMQESDGYMWIAEITGLGDITFERKSGQFLLLK